MGSPVNSSPSEQTRQTNPLANKVDYSIHKGASKLLTCVTFWLLQAIRLSDTFQIQACFQMTCPWIPYESRYLFYWIPTGQWLVSSCKREGNLPVKVYCSTLHRSPPAPGHGFLKTSSGCALIKLSILWGNFQRIIPWGTSANASFGGAFRKLHPEDRGDASSGLIHSYGYLPDKLYLLRSGTLSKSV